MNKTKKDNRGDIIDQAAPLSDSDRYFLEMHVKLQLYQTFYPRGQDGTENEEKKCELIRRIAKLAVDAFDEAQGYILNEDGYR